MLHSAGPGAIVSLFSVLAARKLINLKIEQDWMDVFLTN